MDSTGSIGVGLVGYGLAGRLFHSPYIAGVDGLRLTAIATSQADRQAQAAADHPGAAVVDTVDALLERNDVDLVVVATRTGPTSPSGSGHCRRGGTSS